MQILYHLQFAVKKYITFVPREGHRVDSWTPLVSGPASCIKDFCGVFGICQREEASQTPKPDQRLTVAPRPVIGNIQQCMRGWVSTSSSAWRQRPPNSNASWCIKNCESLIFESDRIEWIEMPFVDHCPSPKFWNSAFVVLTEKSSSKDQKHAGSTLYDFL